jgi:hypothetical protein
VFRPHAIEEKPVTTARKTRTAHCDYCDQDYQTTGKLYRGKGQVFDSCGKAECITACSVAYTAAREQVIAEATAIRAARPQPVRQQRTVYGDYAWMCMLANSKR